MRGEACSKQQGGRRQQILNCAQLTANQQPVYVVLISCMQLISYPQSSCMWHMQQTALGTGCLAAAFRQLVCWLGESLPAHLRVVCPVGLALCAWTSSTRHGAPCLVSSSTCSACISSALAAALDRPACKQLLTRTSSRQPAHWQSHRPAIYSSSSSMQAVAVVEVPLRHVHMIGVGADLCVLCVAPQTLSTCLRCSCPSCCYTLTQQTP